MHDGQKFTLHKKENDDGEETEGLELEINGELFSRHPFISKDYVSAEDHHFIYCAGL